MAKETTYEEIARNLKNKIYSPVYFLMGEEDYYIDRISDYIMDTVLTETEKEFNLTLLYGSDTDIVSIINAARRYPMMSKYQVVIVREAQNLKNLDELIHYLQKPMSSTILVMCYKHGTLDRRKKITAELEKAGVLFESKKLKDTQLPGFISSYLKRKQVEIEPKASEMMAEFVGTDLNRMAGELEKPNKCITLFPEEIETKFWPLPIEDLFMVGRRTAPRLRKMGIRTVGELAAYPPLLLEKEFKSFGKLLHAYANGIDDSPVAPSVSESKSIGNSTTTPFDVTDREAAYKILLALSETVSMRLRQEKLCAEEIAVTLKTANFQVYSHQKQLPNAIDCTNAVYAAAAEIFDEVWKGEPLRLLGVRAGKLCKEDCIQLSLLEQDWSKQKKADAAMDAIRKKYGKNSICRSTFLGEKNTFQKE